MPSQQICKYCKNRLIQSRELYCRIKRRLVGGNGTCKLWEDKYPTDIEQKRAR